MLKRKLQKVIGIDHVSDGNAARDEQRWTDAIVAYKAHLESSPNDFAILVQLGNCSKDGADYATALDAYCRALQIDEGNWDLHLQMGHLYKMMGRRRDATKAYTRVLQINDRSLDALRELDTLKDAGGGEDFSLPPNLLDFIKAKNLDDLIAMARQKSERGDPFEIYGKMVDQ